MLNSSKTLIAALAVLLVGSVAMLVVRQDSGFYEFRLFELVSFIGTTLVGGLIAFHLSRLLTNATGVQQVELERLSKLESGVRECYASWLQHQESPTQEQFQKVNVALKAMGLDVSAMVSTNDADAEALETLWIRMRRTMTDDGYYPDRSCSEPQRRRADFAATQVRNAIADMKRRVFER